MRRLRFKGKRNQGNAAVEFALTLPIFIILVIGIIEFGWYFFVQHTLQYATREGMRVALVGRTITGMDRKNFIIKTIQDNAELAVKRDAVAVSIYKVDPNNNFTDPNSWQGTQDPGLPGDFMRVRSEYNYKFFTPLIGGFFNGGGVVIQAEGTYRNEQFN
jgi:Flp pilus assembly protein TadG